MCVRDCAGNVCGFIWPDGGKGNNNSSVSCGWVTKGPHSMLHTFSSNLLPKQNIKLLKFTNATRLILEALENVACARTPQRFNQMTTIHVSAELTMTKKKSLPMFVRSLSFHVFVIMADPPPPPPSSPAEWGAHEGWGVGTTTQTCLFGVTGKITAVSLMG